MIDPSRTLGDLVAERPARARVLEAAGLDYCCHGRRRLDAACTAAGLDVEKVAADLDEVVDRTGAEVDALEPAALADAIEGTHHVYLHEELPLLEALALKVAGAHGERHPEVVRVAGLVRDLRAELDPHLAKEEDVLFPRVRRHEADEVTAETVRQLEAEHEVAGALLEELRATANGYEVPADGCASYHQLYERLAALEADTHRHIHLENNVLFPALASS